MKLRKSKEESLDGPYQIIVDIASSVTNMLFLLQWTILKDQLATRLSIF